MSNSFAIGVHEVSEDMMTNVTDAGGLSHYGTMAQNGIVFEWIESAFVPPNNSPSKTRVRRGGSWADEGPLIRSSSRISSAPANSDANVGLRVARVFDAGAGQADISVEQPWVSTGR